MFTSATIAVLALLPWLSEVTAATVKLTVPLLGSDARNSSSPPPQFSTESPRMLRALTLSLLAVTAVSAAHAGDYFDLEDEIAGHPGKTWYDAVKAIVPDLKPDGTGTLQIDLPYVVDLGDSDLPPKAVEPITVHSVEVQQIEAEGRQLTLVLADLGEADGWASNVEAMALFDENMTLLDAINVGQDKVTELYGEPIRISARDEAVVTHSEHFNSNQTYGAYAVVMVRDGKFQTIDAVDTLGDRWCGHDRSQAIAVSASDAGAGYWPLTITVTDELKRADEGADCGDEVMQEPWTETYSQTYNWSASMGLYVAGDEGFAELNAINSERY